MFTRGFFVFVAWFTVVGLSTFWTIKAFDVPTNTTATASADVEKTQANVVADGVVDYGNGVYYFDARNFGEHMSAFKLRRICAVPTVTGDGKNVEGGNSGYWVICH